MGGEKQDYLFFNGTKFNSAYVQHYNDISSLIIRPQKVLAININSSNLPPKFEHIFVAVITFFPLSSVQILLLSACCLR